MNVNEAYKAGNLALALSLSAQEVKQKPKDVAARVLFAELCCIAGDLERADKQLQTLLTLSPELAFTTSNWRQLIRAAYSRANVYHEGEVPTLIAEVTPAIEVALAQLVALRSNDKSAMDETLNQSVNTPSATHFAINGAVCFEFRDLDDVNANILEFLGTNGKYFWVDLCQVESITFEKPQRPLDLLWRKCNLTISNGSDGVVFMPTVYPFTQEDPECLLGRSTAWQNQLGCELGSGLREFLVNDDVLSVMELESIARA